MTVISALPSLIEGPDSLNDQGNLLSVLCYWVLPYTLLAMAGVVSGVFPPWFEKRSALVDQREADEAPTVAATIEAPADLSSGPLSLQVPAESSHDEPFTVVVNGVPAGASIELSASGADLFGRTWRSSASFTATEAGSLDLSATDPRSGDWSRRDAAAPLWSMRFAAADRTPELFVAPVDAWPVTVHAIAAGVGEAQLTVRRRTARSEVRTDRSIWTVCPACSPYRTGHRPASGWPAIAFFGGSEGGFASQIGHAVLLASHGYAALAASWVTEENAAKELASIPLERFPTALRFLAELGQVDRHRVSAMAVSRGAEGLLAALSPIPEAPCHNVILVSPSSVTWQSSGADGSIPDTPSWTVQGQPVPWVPVPTGALMPQLIRNAWRIRHDTARHRPTLLRLRPAYEQGLQDSATARSDARIAADRVDCPLLVLTGSEDGVWPSDRMAEGLLGLRDRRDDQHQHYDGAGHLIRLGNFHRRPMDRRHRARRHPGGPGCRPTRRHRTSAGLPIHFVAAPRAGMKFTPAEVRAIVALAVGLFCVQVDFFALTWLCPGWLSS